MRGSQLTIMTADELRDALESEGFTRERFAEEFGVHVATVYRWLSGDIPERTAKHLQLWFDSRKTVKA